MADRREELLKGLLHLGCVEISEPSEVLADPQWASLFQRSGSSLAERKGQLTDVNTALDAIKQYAKLKDGMFIKRHPITEAEFLDAGAAEKAQAACDAVREQLGILTKAQSEAGRLESRAAALKPWESLDLPLERSGTAHTIFRLGVCPGQTDVGAIRVQMEAEGLAAELYEISADKLQKYLLVIVHRGDEEKTQELLRPFGFSAVTFQGMTGTAAENIRSLERDLEANKKTQDDAAAVIAASAENRDALRIYADRLRAEAAKEQCAESVLTDETVLYFQGWVPAEQEKAVGAFLTEKGCAWEALDPTEEEIPNVPVQLKNNWLTKPLNMVTEMYSLPRYDNVDPNPLMAPFFILFYGIMMADMGYGLLMLLAGWIVTKKYHPKGIMGNLFGLMTLCGVSTFIVGAMTGGFFGDFIPQLAKIINPESTLELPYLFTPLQDTMAILVGSLVLGFIQILTGMAISFVKKAKDGHIMDGVWDEGSWWVIFIGAALAILKIGNIGKWPVVLIAGCVMLVIGSTRNAKGFGKLGALIGAIYNGVTGYFSDIMSYSRLMALMLAGSIIASVFNQLGAVTNNVAGFVIISLIGNALNFALNLLGCYVHDLRLQCLEFFNRFYQDGGKPFLPLTFETNYVDIKEEH
nr:V-type ATP synthase subunit I [uncultured Dysosmobacter sp.]